jgi:hypothetical protein
MRRLGTRSRLLSRLRPACAAPRRAQIARLTSNLGVERIIVADAMVLKNARAAFGIRFFAAASRRATE